MSDIDINDNNDNESIISEDIDPGPDVDADADVDADLDIENKELKFIDNSITQDDQDNEDDQYNEDDQEDEDDEEDDEDNEDNEDKIKNNKYNNESNLLESNYLNIDSKIPVSTLEDDESYVILEKYSNNEKLDYIEINHPDSLSKNLEEIKKLSLVIRNEDNEIIDEFHKTIPILTKYEKTKILGIRLKQLNNNCKPYIEIDESILDNLIIANIELNQKKLPFIIQRPIQNRFEYWNIKDLEII